MNTFRSYKEKLTMRQKIKRNLSALGVGSIGCFGCTFQLAALGIWLFFMITLVKLALKYVW